ncbi:uncharacterized protein BDR25DRAFT_291107 [Lindgomyces ingoldianus]|uniref:Uncharacterized protein n=1 Tax=Lindgomyces ingoldianus TaxID=673940 RepID=A0ACB6QNS5_9PLEO|nr:uncharacterized protein BDR25DRAFT_291107 [Lindgomyces ingoldianus]KAF2467765.1 hypothetical protein BDR25DRAFT_291107 [Lindgomyces ingoldianus]
MTHYSCILCGFVIRSSASDAAEQWLREYRAIYSHPSGYSVTGIGCYDGSASWTAPSDPARRWDDDDSNLRPQELPVMRQPPLHGRHGFVLHDACWMLLRRAWGPEEIRVDRLVEMCESIPFPLRTNGLGWQHRYGGLVDLDTQNYFPWQETLFLPREATPVFLDVAANPYDVPTMPAILLGCAKPQPVRGTEKTAHDCFSRLAWELREAITVLLTTAGALTLRQASASFLPLLSSSAFWASRFAGDWERGFVFEMHGCREPTDWLELYRLTSRKSGPTGLRNRSRVWYIIKPLIEVARLERNEGLPPTTELTIRPPWSQVTGDINFDELERNWRPIEQGCYSLRTIIVPVPECLLKIGVSTISFSTTSYVTGLRFVADSASDVRIGYISSSETFFTLQELFGFKVAVSPGGLRALQIVGKNSHLSQWLGCLSGVPVSERLIRSQPIKAVSVRLDGFKIVGLGVSALDAISDQDLGTTGPPLRETALWYPSKPPNELYLNESSFTGQNPCHIGYRPLLWNHFGGQRGSDLKNIVGLFVQSRYRLSALEFVYDGICGYSSSKLGRCNDEVVHPGPMFIIDGVHGELITSVSVHVEKDKHPGDYDFLRYGLLKCFRITTNRGREFQSNVDCNHSEMQSLTIAAGTTITGLYTSYDPQYGLISLGVISELL